MKVFTAEDVRNILALMAGDDSDWLAAVTAQLNGWIKRGDGVAIYTNEDFSSRFLGDVKIVSFGSVDAQLMEAPKTLPDFPGQINWRYQLTGTYRGEQL